jgi:succinate dehydrogenase / fumarate reductase iron-sulfur subunit
MMSFQTIVTKTGQNIPFLYSDKQEINIVEDKQYYDMKFKIEEYNNEVLFLQRREKSEDMYLTELLLDNCNVKGKELVLEPLSKFPVVADLIVDRKTIYENLNHAKTYLEGLVTTNKQLHDHQYSIAKCLKCGLCLEVCPNYHPGASFFGAVFANDSYLTTSQSTNKPTELIKEYKNHFGAGCSKALSCQTICPVGIETITSIMKMNRK